jgi:hypothetical protein
VPSKTESPQGLLVLNVWVEAGGRLRARITRTRDVASDFEVESYASSKAAVVEVVAAWLDGFVTPS